MPLSMLSGTLENCNIEYWWRVTSTWASISLRFFLKYLFLLPTFARLKSILFFQGLWFAGKLKRLRNLKFDRIPSPEKQSTWRWSLMTQGKKLMKCTSLYSHNQHFPCLKRFFFWKGILKVPITWLEIGFCIKTSPVPRGRLESKLSDRKDLLLNGTEWGSRWQPTRSLSFKEHSSPRCPRLLAWGSCFCMFPTSAQDLCMEPRKQVSQTPCMLGLGHMSLNCPSNHYLFLLREGRTNCWQNYEVGVSYSLCFSLLFGGEGGYDLLHGFILLCPPPPPPPPPHTKGFMF